MLKILTDEEAFFMMNQKFSKLKANSIIDLCHNDRRMAAIVVSIDNNNRSFDFLPLDDTGVRAVLSGKLPEVKTVHLSSDPKQVRPMWNDVGS